MRDKFRGKDFLSLMDFTREEINDILNVSYELKTKWAKRELHESLRGKTIAIVFEKPSTRTRTSFQAAIAHLGAQSFYMRPDEMQMARGEPIKDTARVIDRYCDALVMRTFGQDRLEEFARYMKNPVINALSDLTHPCQGLADLLTIREKKGDFKGLKVAYTGDPWNVCHSLMIAGGTMGFDIYIALPQGYPPNPKVRQFATEAAKRSRTRMVVTHNLKAALKDADVVYANTWHSMGAAEKEKEKRARDFGPFQINEKVVEVAKPDFIFMHCLPGYRGEEMTDGIIEGPHSAVWDQAENRMHTEKAVLALFVG
ncbi:MAG: ornithine carbamoyltransferase [Deltaproteobacteria bacterium RBG_16_47_11]|nr:MAG: ornithine carbamoyltransferase [Deltaproteobacteria bacterium RBG_16_47_11]